MTSLPELGSPEALRFAADVAVYLGWLSSANRFRAEADRVEREIEKAKHDALVERIAGVIRAAGSLDAEVPARALLAKFDVTPKSDGGCTR